jgi:hypothetical protein
MSLVSDMLTPQPQATAPSTQGTQARRTRRSALSPDISEVLSMLDAYEEAAAATRR